MTSGCPYGSTVTAPECLQKRSDVCCHDQSTRNSRSGSRDRPRSDPGLLRGNPVKHFRRWGAVYILLVLFLGSWVGQFFTQLSQVRSEQAMHQEPFLWSDYWAQFFSSTFENWQSEWFQLIFQAILLLGAKHWLFQADAEDMERIEKKVDAISERLGLRPNESDEPSPEQQQSS